MKLIFNITIVLICCFSLDASEETTSLPVMKSLVESNNRDFSSITLLVVQHIKHNSLEFVRLLKKSGFKKIIVIGKPYSCNQDALSLMRKDVTVHIPDYHALERLEVIDEVVKPLIANNETLLCLDLGGYFSRYFVQSPTPHLLGIIEDTKNGIWFSEENPPNLPFPLLSVASSRLKDYAEHFFVAKAIVRNSESILMNTFQKSLTGSKILICGYGKIGSNIAKILKPESIVSVYDNDPIALIKAKIDGFRVLRDLASIQEFDMIIGITGQFPINHELLKLKDGAILINGSTRQKEFNLQAISSSILEHQRNATYTLITLSHHKSFVLLADGFPINFFQTESTPEYVLDILYSEMFALLTELEQASIKPGFYPIESSFSEIERAIAALWLAKN